MVIASGHLMLAQENLRTTLAASATFQAMCGAHNATEAAMRIHHNGLPTPKDKAVGRTLEEWQKTRPTAVVYTHGTAGLQMIRDSSSTWRKEGWLVIELERASPTVYEDKPTSEANIDFLNVLGSIIADLGELMIPSDDAYMIAENILLDGWGCGDPKMVNTYGAFQFANIFVRYQV